MNQVTAQSRVDLIKQLLPSSKPEAVSILGSNYYKIFIGKAFHDIYDEAMANQLIEGILFAQHFKS